MEDTTKYKIISLLEQKVAPKQIADDLDVSYASVLRLKREFEEARTNNTVHELIDMDKVIINEVAESLDLPQEAVANVTKGLSGLEVLQDDLQQTATQINIRLKSLIPSVEHPSELQIYTEILCQLQTTFFNKYLTQVNVQNNFGGENPGASHYAKYLSDMPGG